MGSTLTLDGFYVPRLGIVKRFAKTLLLLLVMTSAVFADHLAMPHSYATPSADGKFLFVMIAPIESERDGRDLNDRDRQEAQRIRAKYPVSGMYPNDGSTKALWTVDWHSYSVLVPSDGSYLVRLGPWAQNLSDEAFTFFRNGQPIRTYRIGDLVDTDLAFPHTVSHFRWQENISLDDQYHSLTVATLSKEKYVFDYTTGNSVSARRPLRGVVIGGVVVFAFVIVVLLGRKKLFSLHAI